MQKNYRGGDIDIVDSIVQNNLLPLPLEMFCNCSLKKYIVFARVICALFFLFWPLKNRGA